MNQATGLWDFVRRWKTKVGQEQVLEPNISPKGNINIGGKSYSATSHLITAYDPGFYDLVEPGVKELVKTYIEHTGAITYSSCEGHRYENGFDPRNLGVLPTTYEEYSATKSLFLSCLTRANYQMMAQVKAMEAYLTMEVSKIATDDGPSMTTVEIYFLSLSDNMDTYFEQVDQLTDLLIREIKAYGNIQAK